jgi:hypothetical protein
MGAVHRELVLGEEHQGAEEPLVLAQQADRAAGERGDDGPGVGTAQLGPQGEAEGLGHHAGPQVLGHGVEGPVDERGDGGARCGVGGLGEGGHGVALEPEHGHRR